MFERMKRNWRRDTAAFRASAGGAGHLVRQAADMSSWAVFWAALRGRPPILSDEAVRRIRAIQRTCGTAVALLGLYASFLTGYGLPGALPGLATLALCCLLITIFSGLMLRGPRVPETHRLEYQPAETLPPVKSGQEED